VRAQRTTFNQNRMRRRGCAGLPGGGAGLREVDARYIGGASQVGGVSSLARRLWSGLARQVTRCACGLLAPLGEHRVRQPALAGPCRGGSGYGQEGPERGVTVRVGSAAPVSAGSRGRPREMAARTGFLRRSNMQQYDVPVLARRLRQAGASVIAEPKLRMAGGSRRIGRSGTQLDFAGHDPKPASR
jgi:hypothetical protein